MTRGRPVGVTVDPRGALIVADDLSNTIWRVTPTTPVAVPAAVAAPQDAAPDADEMPDVGATSGAGTAPGAEPEAEPDAPLDGTTIARCNRLSHTLEAPPRSGVDR